MGMVTAVFNQQNFRFRTINPLTALANAAFNASDPALNANIGSFNVNANAAFRIRFEIEETAGGAENVTWNLYCSRNGGAYFQVNNASSIVRTSDNPNYADDTATTNLIAGSARTFLAGYADDSDAVMPNAGNQSWSGNQHTELDIACTVLSAGVNNGDTLDFQIRKSGGTEITYTRTPRITVSKAPPPQVTNLAVHTAYPNAIRLQWDAASGATSYQLERDSVIVESNITGATQTVATRLDPDTEYTFRVRGVSGAGSGDWSAPLVTDSAEASFPLSSTFSDDFSTDPFDSRWEKFPSSGGNEVLWQNGRVELPLTQDFAFIQTGSVSLSLFSFDELWAEFGGDQEYVIIEARPDPSSIVLGGRTYYIGSGVVGFLDRTGFIEFAVQTPNLGPGRSQAFDNDTGAGLGWLRIALSEGTARLYSSDDGIAWTELFDQPAQYLDRVLLKFQAGKELGDPGVMTWVDNVNVAPVSFDPADLDVTIVGTTAELTWSASPTPGVVDYQVFRRTPQTGDPFDPEVDIPIATGITDLFYDDVGLDPDDYDWQVFGRVPT